LAGIIRAIREGNINNARLTLKLIDLQTRSIYGALV
jgi:hypothetical protein